LNASSQPAVAPGSLHAFFGPGGLLARTHPAYEFRRGQLQMAEAVERALKEGRHLIVEAGTGTGKTLAYLLPALRTGQRVIVSTGSAGTGVSPWAAIAPSTVTRSRPTPAAPTRCAT